MWSSIFSSVCALSLAKAAIIPRQEQNIQQYPEKAKAANTFNVGTEVYPGMPDEANGAPVPPIYGPRTIDLPFGRVFHGNMKLWRDDEVSESINKHNDEAKQSACGIPDAAFGNSKVAIHPYFLKYAGLDRELLSRDVKSLILIAT